jgi:hypothetical protein
MKLKNEVLYKIFSEGFISGSPDFNTLNLKIQDICKPEDTFRADRFLYPVNYAYILRNRYYAGNYAFLYNLFRNGDMKLPRMRVMYRKFKATFKRK